MNLAPIIKRLAYFALLPAVGAAIIFTACDRVGAPGIETAEIKCSDASKKRIGFLRDLVELNLSGRGLIDEDLHCLATKDLRRTRMIDLSDNKIKGSGLTALADMEKLRAVSLANNPLGEPGFTALAELGDLRELDLRNVPENGLAILAAFKKLERLRLGGVGISDEKISFLRELKNLAFLEISGAEVDGRFLSFLPAGEQFTELIIDGGNLQDDQLDDLKKLTGLLSLEISHNKIPIGRGLKVLAKSRKLNYLSLKGSPMTTGAAEALSKIDSLSHLDVSETGLRGSDLRGIADLTGLTNLNLRGNSFRDGDMRMLRSLRLLESLNLANTGITESALNNFISLTELRNLDLRGNKWIGDFGILRLLAAQGKLQRLGIEGTKVTPHAFEKLKIQRPNLAEMN